MTQTKLSGYAIDSQALLFDLQGFYDGRLLAKRHSFAIIAAIIFATPTVFISLKPSQKNWQKKRPGKKPGQKP
ncbi:hypothetical protein [Pseudomonas protegens]|uniref:hypothetical protein n=1 Tax=Pseudomonas protegens TaxID=380021 RepID=UPI001E368D64|nr:hypothetical protein [Pseudomonas protegens]MCD9570548.1 hypothetical protein [Pseudomonas protegens]